jgi:hypothetical protein
MDLTSHNATITILLCLLLLFFAAAMYATATVVFAPIQDKLWGFFTAALATLTLALNAKGPMSQLQSH